jgi:trigger factor
MQEQFDQRLQRQGFSLERYLHMIGHTPEQFFQELKVEAERTVKKHFILEKAAEEKGIQVSDEELEEKISELAQESAQGAQEIRETLGDSIADLQKNLILEKTQQALAAGAVVTEMPADHDHDHDDR